MVTFKRGVESFLFLTLFLGSCSTRSNDGNAKIELGDETVSVLTTDTAIDVNRTISEKISDEIPFLKDWEISESDLNRYFPHMLDTVQDRMVAIASRFRQNPWPNVQLSMLRNVGTNEQMFLCTHDTSKNLIDVHYIGKARQMDGTSETIEYNFLDQKNLFVEHIIYIDNPNDVDTLPHTRYTLHITEKGEIIKH